MYHCKLVFNVVRWVDRYGNKKMLLYVCVYICLYVCVYIKHVFVHMYVNIYIRTNTALRWTGSNDTIIAMNILSTQILTWKNYLPHKGLSSGEIGLGKYKMCLEHLILPAKK